MHRYKVQDNGSKQRTIKWPRNEAIVGVSYKSFTDEEIDEEVSVVFI